MYENNRETSLGVSQQPWGVNVLIVRLTETSFPSLTTRSVCEDVQSQIQVGVRTLQLHWLVVGVEGVWRLLWEMYFGVDSYQASETTIFDQIPNLMKVQSPRLHVFKHKYVYIFIPIWWVLLFCRKTRNPPLPKDRPKSFTTFVTWALGKV